MTMKEVVDKVKKIHHEELMALPLQQRIAKLADFVTVYLEEHPEENEKLNELYAGNGF